MVTDSLQRGSRANTMISNPRHNLTQQLTHSLGIAIIRGDYPVGSGLPSEADLCTQFEVSRSATREAVKMLSAKGLIRSRPKQGIQVLPENNWNMFDVDVLEWILNSKPSLTLLKEFMQVRVAIEPQAAELAALNASQQQIEEIAQALSKVVDANKGFDDPVEAGIEFSSAILQASGNRFIVQFTDFIATALRVNIRYVNRLQETADAHVSAQVKLFNHIKAGDGQKAREQTKQMLEQLLENIETKLVA